MRPGEAISLVVPNAANRTLEVDFKGPDGSTYRVESAFDVVGHANIELSTQLANGTWEVSNIRSAGSPAASVRPGLGRLQVSDSAPSCAANFTFDTDQFSETEEQVVRAGLLLGSRYLCGRGVDPMPAATVRANTDAVPPGHEVAAAVPPTNIIVYVNSGWRTVPPAGQIKIIAHEYMHVLQFATRAPTASLAPTWVREGAAEYAAFGAVDAAGITPYPTTRRERLSAFQRVRSTLDDADTTGDNYAMFFFAVELLCEAGVSLSAEAAVDYHVLAADGRIGRQVYAAGDVLTREGFGGPAQAEVFIRQWRNGIDAGVMGPVARTNAAGQWRSSLPLPDRAERGRWYEQPLYRSPTATSNAAFGRYEVGSPSEEQFKGVDLIVAFQKSLRIPGTWEAAFLQFFHQTPAEFNDQFEHFRRLVTTPPPNAQTPLTISLWGRFTAGGLDSGASSDLVPYVFRITGVNLSSMSTEEKAAAFRRPPNTGFGLTRLGSDLMVIYFPPNYPAGTYTAAFELPDDRRAATSFEFIGSPSTNPIPAVTAIQPSSLHAGQPGPLVIRGTGFTPGTTVLWDGMPRTARLIDGGELAVTVSGADLTEGEHIVTATNAAPGGGGSAPYRVEVRPN